MEEQKEVEENNKVGRKSKKHIIIDNLDNIKKWKSCGATDEQIYNYLGISKSIYYKYAAEVKEIKDALKEGTRKLAIDLRGELARQSFKHTLETKKQYIKVDIETGRKTQYTEITTKEVDGNIGAIHLLLKNIDKDNWSNDWQVVELKRQELELRKQMAEDKMF